MKWEWDDSRVNLDPLDRWTLLHLVGWYIAGKSGLSPQLATVGILGWEVIENGVKDTFPELFVHSVHDSRENVVVDILVGAAAYYYGRKNR